MDENLHNRDFLLNNYESEKDTCFHVDGQLPAKSAAFHIYLGKNVDYVHKLVLSTLDKQTRKFNAEAFGILKYYLQNNPEKINAKTDERCYTPLMLAVIFFNQYSEEKTLRLLLEHPQLDVNAVSHSDTSSLNYALMYSFSGSHEKCVTMLMDHPSIDITHSPRKIFKQNCCDIGTDSCVKDLVKAKMTPKKEEDDYDFIDTIKIMTTRMRQMICM